MNKRNIVLSIDSACDLDPKLISQYQIKCCPFNILLDGKLYKDGQDIFPFDIYKIYSEKKLLPKTSSINVGEYISYFESLNNDKNDIIHINLSSGISSTYQNCCIAAREVENVYPVDSLNLSTGISILVIEAANMIRRGLDAAAVQKELSSLVYKIKSSFVVDDLEFLKAGGRCSSIASFGARVLNIKPCIEVKQDGKMLLGKKYRGTFDNVILKYTDDILCNIESIDKKQIFITHAGTSDEYINIVYDKLESTHYFDKIYIQCAGCTVSAHCGPNTLGLMYMIK